MLSEYFSVFRPIVKDSVSFELGKIFLDNPAPML